MVDAAELTRAAELDAPDAPMPAPTRASRVRRIREFLTRPTVLAAALGIVVIVSFAQGGFDARAGDPDGSGYYQRLADAFVKGNLRIDELPPQELLTAENPYDPLVSGSFRRYGTHDAILHDGAIYYYWGPAPVALVVVPARALGIELTETDVGVASLCLIVIVAAFVVDRLARRTGLGRGAQFLFTLVLALPFSGLFMITRVAVWEAHALFASAFGFAALAAFVEAVQRGSLATDARRWWLAGGILAAVGTATRSEVAVLALIPLVLVLVAAWRTRSEASGRWWRRTVMPLALVAVPVGLAVAMLMLYNQLRFGSPTDFGVKEIIGGYDHSALKFSSIAYLEPNLYYYLVRPLDFVRTFPFLDFHRSPWTKKVSGTYITVEPVAGLPFTSPWLVVPLVSAVHYAVMRARRRPRSAHGVPYPLVVMLVVSAFAMMALVSVAIFGATQRYRLLPDLVLGTAAVIVLAYAWASFRRLTRVLISILLFASLGLALLGGAHGYYPHLVPDNTVVKLLRGVTSPLADEPTPAIPPETLVYLEDGCVWRRVPGIPVSLSVSELPSEATQVTFALPTQPWPGYAPLVVRGEPEAADIIGMAWDGTAIKFMHDHWGSKPFESAPVVSVPGTEHRVLVSFDPGAGAVNVYLENALILGSALGVYEESDEIEIGRNSIGATTVLELFNDEIRELDVPRGGPCEDDE